MLLAIDVGNTNVVFALFSGRYIRTRWRLATDPRRTADQYAVWLMHLLELVQRFHQQTSSFLMSIRQTLFVHLFLVKNMKHLGDAYRIHLTVHFNKNHWS